MTSPSGFQMSQGLDVPAPKPDKAYPIPCREWDVLRKRVARLSDEPFLIQTLGSAALGAAVSDIVAIVTGSVTGKDPVRAVEIAWAVAAVLVVIGLVALHFASKERKAHHERASDIVEDMVLIEERYDKDAAPSATAAASGSASHPTPPGAGVIQTKAQGVFKELEPQMRTLFEEMRQDVTKAGNSLIRDFFVLPSRGVGLNVSHLAFIYYETDHTNLHGMIAVLENNAFVTQRKVGNAPCYRMTEEFVRLLLM